jgi:hybrid cluster-associated redox disulfide protein
MSIGELDLEKEFNKDNKSVTGDILVGNLVNEHPELLDTLMEVGMHCVGCPASQMESLNDAAMVHGLDPEAVVAALNKKLAGV